MLGLGPVFAASGTKYASNERKASEKGSLVYVPPLLLASCFLQGDNEMVLPHTDAQRLWGITLPHPKGNGTLFRQCLPRTLQMLECPRGVKVCAFEPYA